MKKINPWMVTTIVLIIAVVIILFQQQIGGVLLGQNSQDVANKAIKYINSNIVAPNTSATFTSVSDFKGLYNITLSYQGQNVSLFATRDGSYVFLSQPLLVGENITQPAQPKGTIGSFLVDVNSEVCTENSKPIVYFFGSQQCPHCMWEDPVIRNVTSFFQNQISFHENIDTDKDKEIFIKYSPSGYIPLILVGCKYYRIGSGEAIGTDQEASVLAALICSLTSNKPLSVCANVETLINQIGQ